uniref:Uncharacterized protein n=1 Tax=Entomoneis paludosa TaxID=265537 RepID=A0A7S2Y3L4_9STRA|mmetsp:Transcript_12960/g.26897  ORF Transcript_12960/g.26897 Transcript_12960/m.26897 type:complete len:129 (+) Transcript_12960:165-551(+)|eukprot:CAMPEP_0172461638 /NCGR_PEP_ID=MMETSP1065-20121228/41213_1 /TAXON_ID=265537 /ORGANISM="Amphiprora paludosa, Strain CCMP125" /LENGTH=128 /DNA_ID=CAMNT_0013217031 /DNA_START=132 /DNA_END=518 /DNA_ORIENTATION=+
MSSDHAKAINDGSENKKGVGTKIMKVFRLGGKKKSDDGDSSSIMNKEDEDRGRHQPQAFDDDGIPININSLMQEKSDYNLGGPSTSDSVIGPRATTAEYSSSVREIQVSPDHSKIMGKKKNLDISLTL